jgi:hypothetical protein
MSTTDLTHRVGAVDARRGGNGDSGDGRSRNGGSRESLAVNNEYPMVGMKVDRLPDALL